MGTQQARALKQRLGFTLLEALVGAMVTSVVLLGVGAVWAHHQRIFRQSRNRITAKFLLESEMEKVKASGFQGLDELAAAPPTVYVVNRKTSGVTQSHDFTSRIVHATAATEGNTTTSEMRKAIVTIDFEEGNETKTMDAEIDLFKTQ